MLRVQATLRLALMATAVFASPLWAQQYPTKPAKIIVAFAPGGGNDLIARVVAQRLTTALGQQFIVENKPGAGGSIGFRSGIKSPADGYTLLLISSSYAVNASLYRLDYDPIADITPVIETSNSPFLLVVNPRCRQRTSTSLSRSRSRSPARLTSQPAARVPTRTFPRSSSPG